MHIKAYRIAIFLSSLYRLMLMLQCTRGVCALYGALVLLNPWRMRCRVTVVILCVCVCVCLSVCLSIAAKSAAYLVFTLQTKFYRVLYGVFNVFTVWLSLKTLCSRVLASFAGHRCLPRSLASFQWTNEIAMASFQLEKYTWLVIDPTTGLVHH